MSDTMSNAPVSLTPHPEGYADWLADLKGRVHTARQRATLAVNRRAVAEAWPDTEFVRQAAAQLPCFRAC